MTEPTPELLYRADGGIARLTLNRPEKRNALGAALVDGLMTGLGTAEADDAVRVIALAGAGTDFCAGADLGALQRMAEAPILENLADADRLGALFLRLRSVSKPVVALVHGRALAGGCGLALACDLILARSDASFGFTEIRLGFVPALVTAILARNTTEKIAFDLITGGDVLPAESFERFGLVNRVWPAERFEAEVDSYLAALASRDAGALRLCKRLLYRQGDMSFGAAIAAGAEVNTIARSTDGMRAGVDAFLSARRSREG